MTTLKTAFCLLAVNRRMCVAPSFWYCITALVLQRKVVKKYRPMDQLFWYHSKLLTMETQMIVCHTITKPNYTAWWKQGYRVPWGNACILL